MTTLSNKCSTNPRRKFLHQGIGLLTRRQMLKCPKIGYGLMDASILATMVYLLTNLPLNMQPLK